MPILKVELARDLPEGWTPLEVISVVKCLDEDGDVAVATRTSEGISPWEMLGMLEAAKDQLRDILRSQTTNHERDDE